MGTTTAITVGLLLVAASAVNSVVLAVTSGWIWDDWILDARGVQRVAEVVERRATYVRENPARHWTLRWRARDDAGREIEGEAYTAVGDATRVVVQYDPARPARARVLGESALRSRGATVASLVLLALAMPVFALGVRRARRRKALYREGSPALATVLASEPTWIRSGGDPVRRVTLRFTSPQGERSVTLATTDALQVGERAWLLHDPQRPERAILA